MMTATGKLLYLNRHDVNRLLDIPSCIAWMRTAMACVAKGATIQPIRSGVPVPGGAGILGMMPGAMSEPEALGIKIVTVFPGNFNRGLSSHQGFVTLFDVGTGTPLALMDASVITAVRTGCASAVATDLLARSDSRVMTMMGYGEQAQTHIAAIRQVRALARVIVWGRNEEKALHFARVQSEKHGIDISVEMNACKAVQAADIICAMTPSKTPILKGDWLMPGQHLNVVGSGTPEACEIDVGAVRRSKFYTDYTPSVETLGGEYRAALEEGVIGEDHIIGEIGGIMTGACPGRGSDQEITLFKSLGMVAEDLITAHHLCCEAKKRDIGIWLDH